MHREYSNCQKGNETFYYKFVIQTITKASSITFGKSRNFHIISVAFTGVNKSTLLGNTASGYINKYRISNYTDTKRRKK